jgi:hypothetical protein
MPRSKPAQRGAPAVPKIVRLPQPRPRAEADPIVMELVPFSAPEEPAAPPASRLAIVTTPETPESVAPGAVQLAKLLSSGDGLRNAILLHEIFGPPRSRHYGFPSIS